MSPLREAEQLARKVLTDPDLRRWFGAKGEDPELLYWDTVAYLEGKTFETPDFLSATTESPMAESISGLPFAPISEALAGVPDEPEWVWDGYLAPEALTLLAGRPKVGKSTLAFAFFRALSAGMPFVGRETRKGRILVLSEERPVTLKEKTRIFNLDGSVHLLMRHQAGSLEWPQVIEHAAGYCRDHELGVLVVDVWDKWTNLRGDSENSAGHVIEALKPLQEAASSGLAVLIVAHQRKAAGSHGEAVRGNNALTGGVDVVLELERAPSELKAGSSVRILRAESRFAGTPEELAVELTDDTYAAVGDVEGLKARTECDRIRTTLEALGTGTAKEVADGAELPEATVRRRLDELLNTDEAAREGNGKKGDPYRWTFRPETERWMSEIHSATGNSLMAERKNEPRSDNGKLSVEEEGSLQDRCAAEWERLQEMSR